MARLQVYNSPTDFYEYDLEDKSLVVVGRSSNTNITIQSNYVSRSHCSFILLEKEEVADKFYWVIKDSNSSNGTWVNNNRIQVCTLKNADIITFMGNSDFPKIIYLCELESDTESKETGAYEYAEAR
jgi:pSer/pThr/pTyr-binding forkhead associated (FHA) protein